VPDDVNMKLYRTATGQDDIEESRPFSKMQEAVDANVNSRHGLGGDRYFGTAARYEATKAAVCHLRAD
jgi:hypothetical protein